MSAELIKSFYDAFKSGNHESMARLYHPDIIFNDPVFENLDFENVTSMWQMLVERSKGDLVIEYHSIESNEEKGSCIWEAKYHFSKTKRPIHNIIKASMEFQDGLIIKHTDLFNFWKWSGMALGTPGKLLGWSPYIKNKVRSVALKSLKDYKKKKNVN